MFGGTTFGTCIKKLIYLHLGITEEEFAKALEISLEELNAILSNSLFPTIDFIDIIIDKYELKEKKSYIAKEILAVYRSVANNGVYQPKRVKERRDPRNPFTKKEEQDLFGIDESYTEIQYTNKTRKKAMTFTTWFKSIQIKYALTSLESIKIKLMLEDEEKIVGILSGDRLADEDFCARLRYMVLTEEDAKEMDAAYQKSRSDFYNNVDIYKEL